MNRIKTLRKKHNITQSKFCKILNIAQPTLSGYETGNFQPDNQTLFKIADYFNESVDYLLGREKPKNRLSIMRQYKKISTKRVAQELDVNEETYMQIENEFLPMDQSQLKTLSEFYQVKTDFLIGKPYRLTIPVERWHKSLQEDYAKASKEEKICMEYKYGGVVFDCDKLGIAPAFTEEERALGLSDNHPIALSDDDRELINLFAEAEEKLGKTYVRGIKQMVRLHIDSKDKS